MKQWAVADCETDSFDGEAVTPFIWGYKHEDGEEIIFHSNRAFVNFIRERDEVLYAHNGGKFDWMLLSEYFERGDVKIINGRIARAYIGKCELRDSFLILPTSLGSTGLKDEFDYEILDRRHKEKRKQHAAEIEKYLIQDVRGLFELVALFRSRFGDRLTQAGAALATWEGMGGIKRRYGKAHDDFFRPFYFGGRCQAFDPGVHTRELKYFDIKSAYPFAMRHSHPAGRCTDYTRTYDLKKLCGPSFWHVKAVSRGALALKTKYSTEFPTDAIPREYFATGWEIMAGLETGTLEIIEAVGFLPPATESLKSYVDVFYQEKADAEENGDKARRTIAKIFLNSLYGKFGANPESYKDFRIVDIGSCGCGSEHDAAECPEAWELYEEHAEYDIVQRPARAQYFDVALAASITGFARAYLWRHACKSKGLVYCDTDSLICESGEFDIGKELGQWEEVATLEAFYCAGKKLYAGKEKGGEWITAHKGFSKLDVEVQDIIDVATGAAFFIEENDKGELVRYEGRKIKRKAPTIKLDGAQHFITRTMRKTA